MPVFFLRLHVHMYVYVYVCFVFFNLEFFLQGGQQCWALCDFLAACPCMLFIDIICICLLIGQIKMLACLHLLIHLCSVMIILCDKLSLSVDIIGRFTVELINYEKLSL